ncbi:MAG TPA: hypothetical protein VNE71_17010 [Myxococcota bacterium]|nr:hypothetical protein [Myxococcota bacterium]
MMRRIASALAACAALAATAPAAGALELASGWLTSETGEELRCRVVNVGKKPATVLVVLVDNTGASIADITFPGCDGTPLAPNGFCSAVVDGSNSAYCRITTSSKQIRGVLTISPESGGSATVAVPVTK